MASAFETDYDGELAEYKSVIDRLNDQSKLQLNDAYFLGSYGPPSVVAFNPDLASKLLQARAKAESKSIDEWEVNNVALLYIQYGAEIIAVPIGVYEVGGRMAGKLALVGAGVGGAGETIDQLADYVQGKRGNFDLNSVLDSTIHGAAIAPAFGGTAIKLARVYGSVTVVAGGAAFASGYVLEPTFSEGNVLKSGGRLLVVGVGGYFAYRFLKPGESSAPKNVSIAGTGGTRVKGTVLDETIIADLNKQYADKNISVKVDPAFLDKLPGEKRTAAFVVSPDGKATIYLRENPTYYEYAHEAGHAANYKTTGGATFESWTKIPEIEREYNVFNSILETDVWNRLTPLERQNAIDVLRAYSYKFYDNGGSPQSPIIAKILAAMKKAKDRLIIPTTPP
jgi:hypothetical protein